MTKARSYRRRFAAPGAVIAFSGALLGCTQFADATARQTTVFPLSDWGTIIQDLYSLIFLMSVVVFVGVEGFLLYTIIRYRRRREDEMPAQVHGNTRLEVTWTVLPSIVLLIIAVPTIGAIFAQDAPPPVPSSDVVKLRVIGHQWWWEFEYPDLGVKTANEFHLPLGKTATIELKSTDVVHSFWLPRMGGKVDVVPGARANHMWFTPKETGEFYGQCVEFCGTQHANMKLRLFVDTPQGFAAWADSQRSPAVQPASGPAQQGAELFQSSACVGCHTVQGTAAQGKVGPDLTHVGSRGTIAAGMVDNTPENMRRWIQDPQALKPGNLMPRLGLDDAQTQLLVAYLQSLQ